MYRAPENSNRVKAIKSRFENNENQPAAASLSRQLSDPINKCTIKRSPAFRNDKAFQRSGTQISCRAKLENKSLNTNCDNKREASSFNSLRKRFDSQENLCERPKKGGLLVRSNTSGEIVLKKQENEALYENICMLYTEPIPKSQRSHDIHNISTLKISDKSHIISSCHDDDLINFKLNALTDTLKLALKKPLPPGPAPKKPPRTFAHLPKNETPKKLNSDFAKKLNENLTKKLEVESKKKTRSDPKYMLDKLETALKNKKQRLRRQAQVDYSSEEDCDKVKNKFNFNCLNSCSNAAYEAIGNNDVTNVDDEPVYAEPFIFPANVLRRDTKSQTDDKKLNRNSLYYLSSPVLSAANESYASDVMDSSGFKDNDTQDSSSVSTPLTSDADSVSSLEDSRIKVQNLIKSFEQKTPPVDKRVDHLEKQLRHTLDSSFRSENESASERSSTDGEANDTITGKFETYVRTVRLHQRALTKNKDRHLFHCCLLVGLSGREPYIKFKFPPNVDLPYKIEELCFPDSSDSMIDCSPKAQNYSIVVTNNSGERIFGYCRRVLPEDSPACLPLAYCILSKRRAPRFYRRVLEEIESRHGIPDRVRDILFNEFYYHRFPSPDESIRISLAEVNKHLSDNGDGGTVNGDVNRKSEELDLTGYVVVSGKGEYGTLNNKEGYNRRNGTLFSNGGNPDELVKDLFKQQNRQPKSITTSTELVITMHQDSRHKENDLEELCSTLNLSIIQKVFASLLLERKVIFISCLLGKLSICIEALQNILYPFTWPHTLIPVVPKELWEIVEAPTPVLCGVLSLNVVNDFTIENGIVVDLDEQAIVMEVGDETKILPSCLLKQFKEAMILANSTANGNNAHNVLLSDAFIRVFVGACGHYKDFLKNGRFLNEEFIAAAKTKGIRRFLKWFTETTMFHTFVDSVVEDSNTFRIFDKRIKIYGSQDATAILEKMKDWKKDKSTTLFF